MKRFRVIIQESAEHDIDQAFRWIAERESIGAQRWFRGIQNAIDSLALRPRRFRRAPESPAFGFEIRQIVFGRYRVLFTIVRSAVHVLHVRQGARRKMQRGEIAPPER